LYVNTNNFEFIPATDVGYQMCCWEISDHSY